MGLVGLTQINIELTSACDKHTLCAFCGHQDPTIHPHLTIGQMSYRLLTDLSDALPPGLVIQFHRDGDPLAFSGDLSYVLALFAGQLRSIVTHGERLAERADELIGHCEAVTVSVFRGDPDRDRQYHSVKSFHEQKGDRLPRLLIKVVGDMSEDELSDYRRLGVPIMRRKIHVPLGNSKYANGFPAMPEHGVCLDLLHHPSVAWDGRVYLCNRLDTQEKGLIGNLNEQTLEDIWNGPLRQDYIRHHLHGLRDLVPPCANCTYWGVPTS